MIKIVLCEDQIEHQVEIKNFLNQTLIKNSIEYTIYTFNSGEELLKNYIKDIDIFILDIQMNEISGMDVARKIREIDRNKPEIVFTTSIIDYIQEGYEVRAYRYLLKPIKLELIEKHILSCIKDIEQKKDNYLIINCKSEVYKVDINKITYIEVQNKCMTIHTLDKNYEVKMSLDNVEKELEKYNFFRCHKSFLVNVDYIENIKQYVAILENGVEVLVSRHRFKDLKFKFLHTLGDVI